MLSPILCSRLFVFVIWSVVALTFIGAPKTMAARPPKKFVESKSLGWHVEKEVLVVFRQGVAEAEQLAWMGSAGVTLSQRIEPVGICVLRLGAKDSVEGFLARWRGDARIAKIDANSARTTSQNLGDQLWYLQNVGQTVGGVSGPAGVDIRFQAGLSRLDPWLPDIESTSHEEVVVAVVDTGAAILHRELTGRLRISSDPLNGLDDDRNGYIDDAAGWNFVDHDYDMIDRDGHGTMVAGIIGAEWSGGVGGIGVNPMARIVPIRVFDQWGEMRAPGGLVDISVLAQAFFYAERVGARVVNLSLGGPQFNEVEELLVLYMGLRGILLVCAAGNGGADGLGDNNDVEPVYPAGYQALGNVISVAAVDRSGGLATFSNYGSNSVHVAAPGTQIVAPTVTRTVLHRWDFTGTSPNWTTAGDTGNEGYASWQLTASSVRDGSGDSNYLANTNSWLRSPLVSTDYQAAPKLRFQYRLDIEEPEFFSFLGWQIWDYVAVEHQAFFGSWRRNALLARSTGGNWAIAETDLRDLDGGSGYFRFRLVSDGIGHRGGIEIDWAEVTVADIFGSATNPQYTQGGIQGTSFAAPIVAGMASLLWMARPDLTVFDIREAILEGSRSVALLSGRLEHGMADLDGAAAHALALPQRTVRGWMTELAKLPPEFLSFNPAKVGPAEDANGNGVPNAVELLFGEVLGTMMEGSIALFEREGSGWVYRLPDPLPVAGTTVRIELQRNGGAWTTVARKPSGYVWEAVTNPINAVTFKRESVRLGGRLGWAIRPVGSSSPDQLLVRAVVDVAIDP